MDFIAKATRAIESVKSLGDNGEQDDSPRTIPLQSEFDKSMACAEGSNLEQRIAAVLSLPNLLVPVFKVAVIT